MHPTFLLTDIEGSTRLWEADPPAMSTALARQCELVDAAVARAGGLLPKAQGEGDSALAVFADAAAAVRATLDIQLALAAERWPGGLEIRVRAALHTGPAEQREGDWFGPTINRCARLRALAHGGQTLLSEATATSSAGSLPDGVAFRDLGTHRLRDLTRPERVFQLLHPGLGDAFPPLRSRAVRASNLPLRITTFVGRESEVAELRSLIEEHALVTLAGPGGVGKTRLAVEAADALRRRFPDGVWLAELASLQDGTGVTGAVAEAVGVREEPGRTLWDTLLDELAGRELLLVLDNCEHVLPATTALVDAIVRTCAQVRVLATSREILRVPGEVTRRVRPLALPQSGSHGAAVDLFVDRARRAGAFELSDDTLEAVARICRRLDGLPLAIELAAARTSALTPRAIADRLDDRFEILGDRDRGVVPRQRTMRELVGWSYDLLEPEARRALTALSVFAGGWTLEAARDVCDVDASVLAGLVDRSLVQVQDERFSLLETIRAFASDRLAEQGGTAAVRRRHVAHHVDLAERASQRFGLPEQPAWLDRLELELDNLRAALANAEPVERLQLATALADFWSKRGYAMEGRTWLDRALAADGLPDAQRLRGLLAAGRIAVDKGDVPAAERLLGEALELARACGDRAAEADALMYSARAGHSAGRPDARRLADGALVLFRDAGERRGEADALLTLGVLSAGRGAFEESLLPLGQALSIYEDLDDVGGVGGALLNIGGALLRLGRLAEARERIEQSLEMARRAGELDGVAYNLFRLGEIAEYQGDVPAARNLYEESLGIARANGARSCEVMNLYGLGGLAEQEGDTGTAHRQFSEALAIARRSANSFAVSRILHALGRLLLNTDGSDRASPLLAEALELMQRLDDRLGVLTCLEDLACASAAAGDDPARAARLLGASVRLRDATGAPVLPVRHDLREQTIRQLRSVLGDEAFGQAWERGGTMDAQEVVADARDLATSGRGS